MKLEIDLTDRASLLKTQTELNRLLNIIQYALNQLPDRRNGQPDLSNVVITHPDNDHIKSSNLQRLLNGLDQEVLHIIYTSLEKRFTTSDVMVQMGTKAKENRGAIKMALKRAVDADFIRLVEPGRGRKPSTYERLMDSLSKKKAELALGLS